MYSMVYCIPMCVSFDRLSVFIHEHTRLGTKVNRWVYFTVSICVCVCGYVFRMSACISEK